MRIHITSIKNDIFFTGSACTVDLIFVVDSSYLLSSTGWQYFLNFTASIAQRLAISPTASQVGFVSYDFFGTDRFYLNTYISTSQVVNAILGLTYDSGWSHEYNGITQMYTTSFQAAKGNRLFAPDIAVVISGTPYNQGPSPVLPAQSARNKNITILSVGVSSASLDDVYNISSPPRIQNSTYWYIPTFDKLYSYAGQLSDSICRPQSG